MILGNAYPPVTSTGARRRGLAGIGNFDFDGGALLEKTLGVEPEYIKNQLSLLEQLLVASTAASVGTFLFVMISARGRK